MGAVRRQPLTEPRQLWSGHLPASGGVFSKLLEPDYDRISELIQCGEGSRDRDKLSSQMFTLYLMTQKGFRVLNALLAEGYAPVIDLVVGAADKGSQNDFRNEIEALCASHHVPYASRQDAPPNRSPLSMAISWRWLIDEPATTLIVLHDSLLPKYRGFAPLVTALVNGDREIGVTAVYAAGKYDRGDIIVQESVSISYPIRICEAIEQISGNYVSIARYIFERATRGDALPRRSQNESEASFSLWRDELDYLIRWDGNAGAIRRFVDATGFPYLGAYTYLDGHKIRILSAEERPDVSISNRDFGKVISTEDGCPVVVCGECLLRLTEVVDDVTRKSLLPFPRFRVRLTSLPL